MFCLCSQYMAPELYFDEPYGVAADLFSFAMVLVEVIEPIECDGVMWCNVLPGVESQEGRSRGIL